MKKILILLLLFIPGCGIIKGLEAQSNRKKLRQLEIGMTKKQVVESIGRPYNRENYPDGEIWLYITEWKRRYTTLDEMTPLVFKENKLVGWGRQYIDYDLKTYELRLR